MKVRVLCAAVAVSGLATATAQAQSPWYVSGSLGGYFREDASGPATFFRIGQPSITATGTQNESFDPGILANAAVGYRLPAGFRVEAELGYANYLMSRVNPTTSNASFPALNGQNFDRRSGGELSRFMGTLNAFYDLPLKGSFIPYVGLGIGGAHRENTTGVFANSAGDTFTQTGSASTEAVVLVEGGVSIALSGNLSLVPAYRYLRYFAGGGNLGDEAAHVAKLGLRYSF